MPASRNPSRNFGSKRDRSAYRGRVSLREKSKLINTFRALAILTLSYITLVSRTSNQGSSIAEYNSARFDTSTSGPPLRQVGSTGRARLLSATCEVSTRMRRNAASTSAEMVVRRRAASSRNRRITRSSMLSVVFIWITINDTWITVNKHAGRMSRRRNPTILLRPNGLSAVVAAASHAAWRGHWHK